MKQKQRYWLFKRRHTYYVEDSFTGEQKSLCTSDKQEAERIRSAKSEAVERSQLGLVLAKAYLAAYDPRLLDRSWAMVMEEFCSKGKMSSQTHGRRAIKHRAFDLIRHRKFIETTADDLRDVIKNGGTFTNHLLRCLHNLALGLGRLPWPIIPPKLWPVVTPKPKRAITWNEHIKIIQSEKNDERRLYYELLWEVGASQTDAAMLTDENIDWPSNVLTYHRLKTGELACMSIGSRLRKLLEQLPDKGPFFPTSARHWTRTAPRNSGVGAEFLEFPESVFIPIATPGRSGRK